MNRKIQKECESGCEYILPDYMGDIKKLLSYKMKAIPTGKFVSDGVLEVSGTAEYEVVYADSDGRLTVISASSDYTENFKIREGYLDSFADCKIGSTKIKVVGPRKLSLKCTVSVSLLLEEEINTNVGGNAFLEDGGIETDTRVINCMSLSFKKSAEREYADVIERLDGVACEDVEIISSSAKTLISEVSAEAACVRIKGENITELMIRSTERPPFAVRCAVPFEEAIEAEESREGIFAFADGLVSSVNVAVSGDENGVSIISNLICEYNVTFIENKSVEIISDAYLIDKKCENRYEDTAYSEHIYSTFSVAEAASTYQRESMLLLEAKDIIYSAAQLRSSEASLTADGLCISGEIAVTGIACEFNVDGSVSYIPVKADLPFSKKISTDLSVTDGCEIDYSISVSDLSLSLLGEEVSARCRIPMKISLLKRGTVRRLAASNVSEEEMPQNKNVISVCYPSRGESLFEIGKRYRKPTAAIASDNNLSESAVSSPSSAESLAGVKKLIII